MEKRIPVGAGLAGGSSDAASTLIAMRDLFDLDLTDADMLSIARTLGSDIAFFCPPDPGAPAFVAGLGERVLRATHVDADLLLIVPPFGCNTGAVYRAFDDDPPDRFRETDVREMASAGRLDPDQLFNDLAAPAMRVAPDLRDHFDRARDVADSPVHITGSGSGLFILDPRASSERELASALPDCAVIATRLIPGGAP